MKFLSKYRTAKEEANLATFKKEYDSVIEHYEYSDLNTAMLKSATLVTANNTGGISASSPFITNTTNASFIPPKNNYNKSIVADTRRQSIKNAYRTLDSQLGSHIDLSESFCAGGAPRDLLYNMLYAEYPVKIRDYDMYIPVDLQNVSFVNDSIRHSFSSAMNDKLDFSKIQLSYYGKNNGVLGTAYLKADNKINVVFYDSRLSPSQVVHTFCVNVSKVVYDRRNNLVITDAAMDGMIRQRLVFNSNTYEGYRTKIEDKFYNFSSETA